MKKLANILQNLADENVAIYDVCRQKLDDNEDLLEKISISDKKQIINSMTSIKNNFSYIAENIETAKSNGQYNEDSLNEGNSIIEFLNKEINRLKEATIKNSRLKKISFKFICDIHDDIIKYCNVAIQECEESITNMNDELVDSDDIEYIVNDFISDTQINCVWVRDLIVDAEHANERMSNGIIDKENKISILNQELEELDPPNYDEF